MSIELAKMKNAKLHEIGLKHDNVMKLLRDIDNTEFSIVEIHSNGNRWANDTGHFSSATECNSVAREAVRQRLQTQLDILEDEIKELNGGNQVTYEKPRSTFDLPTDLLKSRMASSISTLRDAGGEEE